MTTIRKLEIEVIYVRDYNQASNSFTAFKILAWSKP